MTELSQRRRRILKIRSIERRIAEQELAHSEKGLRHVTMVADRIATLRGSTIVSGGLYNGGDLQASSEMADRLDAAHRNLELSLLRASAVRDQHRGVLVDAKQRETGAEKLAESAVNAARRKLEIHETTTRIFRKNRTYSGTSL
jgi:hypothetical protein